MVLSALPATPATAGAVPATPATDQAGLIDKIAELVNGKAGAAGATGAAPGGAPAGGAVDQAGLLDKVGELVNGKAGAAGGPAGQVAPTSAAGGTPAGGAVDQAGLLDKVAELVNGKTGAAGGPAGQVAPANATGGTPAGGAVDQAGLLDKVAELVNGKAGGAGGPIGQGGATNAASGTPAGGAVDQAGLLDKVAELVNGKAGAAGGPAGQRGATNAAGQPAGGAVDQAGLLDKVAELVNGKAGAAGGPVGQGGATNAAGGQLAGGAVDQAGLLDKVSELVNGKTGAGGTPAGQGGATNAAGGTPAGGAVDQAGLLDKVAELVNGKAGAAGGQAGQGGAANAASGTPAGNAVDQAGLLDKVAELVNGKTGAAGGPVGQGGTANAAGGQPAGGAVDQAGLLDKVAELVNGKAGGAGGPVGQGAATNAAGGTPAGGAVDQAGLLDKVAELVNGKTGAAGGQGGATNAAGGQPAGGTVDQAGLLDKVAELVNGKKGAAGEPTGQGATANAAGGQPAGGAVDQAGLLDKVAELVNGKAGAAGGPTGQVGATNAAGGQSGSAVDQAGLLDKVTELLNGKAGGAGEPAGQKGAANAAGGQPAGGAVDQAGLLDKVNELLNGKTGAAGDPTKEGASSNTAGGQSGSAVDQAGLLDKVSELLNGKAGAAGGQAGQGGAAKAAGGQSGSAVDQAGLLDKVNELLNGKTGAAGGPVGQGSTANAAGGQSGSAVDQAGLLDKVNELLNGKTGGAVGGMAGQGGATDAAGGKPNGGAVDQAGLLDKVNELLNGKTGGAGGPVGQGGTTNAAGGQSGSAVDQAGLLDKVNELLNGKTGAAGGAAGQGGATNAAGGQSGSAVDQAGLLDKVHELLNGKTGAAGGPVGQGGPTKTAGGQSGSAVDQAGLLDKVNELLNGKTGAAGGASGQGSTANAAGGKSAGGAVDQAGLLDKVNELLNGKTGVAGQGGSANAAGGQSGSAVDQAGLIDKVNELLNGKTGAAGTSAGQGASANAAGGKTGSAADQAGLIDKINELLNGKTGPAGGSANAAGGQQGSAVDQAGLVDKLNELLNGKTGTTGGAGKGAGVQTGSAADQAGLVDKINELLNGKTGQAGGSANAAGTQAGLVEKLAELLNGKGSQAGQGATANGAGGVSQEGLLQLLGTLLNGKAGGQSAESGDSGTGTYPGGRTDRGGAHVHQDVVVNINTNPEAPLHSSTNGSTRPNKSPSTTGGKTGPYEDEPLPVKGGSRGETPLSNGPTPTHGGVADPGYGHPNNTLASNGLSANQSQGQPAPAAAAAVIRSTSGAATSMEPQTAAQALAQLQGVSGFGKGVLTRSDGVVLAPDSRLQPGGSYTFRPHDAGGASGGPTDSSQKPIDSSRGLPAPPGLINKAPVTIENTNVGATEKLEPQSVADALERLRHVPGFGPGTLRTSDGTILAPERRLEPSMQVSFVPSAESGNQVIGSSDGSTAGEAPVKNGQTAANSAPVIVRKANGQTLSMEPQTVAQALEQLKRASGFGPGSLKTPAGVLLAPDTRLRPGMEVTFVPSAASGNGSNGNQSSTSETEGAGSGTADGQPIKSAAPVTIKNPAGGAPLKLEPQTVAQTLEQLKRSPGFGPGSLRNADGIILAPGTQLKPGAEVTFVPDAAAGESNDGSAKPPVDNKGPSPATRDGQGPVLGAGDTKSPAPITIKNPSGGEPAKLEPQTVGQALEQLKRLPEFGPGTLKDANGTVLSPETKLRPGMELSFVPSAAKDKLTDSNAKPPVDNKAPSPANTDGEGAPLGATISTDGQANKSPAPIVIKNPSGGGPAKLEPQTVGQALEQLKRLPGFGPGTLTDANGTILSPDTPLRPGMNLSFVPSAASGTSRGQESSEGRGIDTMDNKEVVGPNGPKGGDGQAGARPVTIKSPSGGEPAKLEPQTVGQALEQLKRLPGFGPGTLKDANGTILSPDTKLRPGMELSFVPSAAAGSGKGQNARDGQGAAKNPEDADGQGGQKGQESAKEREGASPAPVIIKNPSGGAPAKLEPQTVAQALKQLEGVDGFGGGRLQGPDGKELAPDAVLKAGMALTFVPAGKSFATGGKPVDGDKQPANNGSANDPVDGSGGKGSDASSAPVRIKNKSSGASQPLEPQTVGQALDALKGVDGFGEGSLRKPDGTILAPGSRLQPGVDYDFVPAAKTSGQTGEKGQGIEQGFKGQGGTDASEGASPEPITIKNPNGGAPVKLEPQTVAQALKQLEGVDGFGGGRLQGPDGKELAPDAVLKPGMALTFVPAGKTSGGGKPVGGGTGDQADGSGGRESDASAAPVRIKNKSSGASQSVEPQTVGEALALLKGVDGFGGGSLRRPDGTILAPGSRLQPGIDYDFFPAAKPSNPTGGKDQGTEQGSKGQGEADGSRIASPEPITIKNPNGGAPAKLEPQTVAQALKQLEGVDGFGGGRLQGPDGKELSPDAVLKPGMALTFVPAGKTSGGSKPVDGGTGGQANVSGGKGSDASAEPVRIKNKSSGASQSVEPQTVSEALELLKDVTGFGDGSLRKADGTILAKGSRLQPGIDYDFFPAAKPGPKEEAKPSPAETPSVAIKNKTSGAVKKMEPNTVEEALAALKQVAGFGEGRLQRADGTILSKSSTLQGGIEYHFVPKIASGDTKLAKETKPAGETEPKTKDEKSPANGTTASESGSGNKKEPEPAKKTDGKQEAANGGTGSESTEKPKDTETSESTNGAKTTDNKKEPEVAAKKDGKQESAKGGTGAEKLKDIKTSGSTDGAKTTDNKKEPESAANTDGKQEGANGGTGSENVEKPEDTKTSESTNGAKTPDKKEPGSEGDKNQEQKQPGSPSSVLSPEKSETDFDEQPIAPKQPASLLGNWDFEDEDPAIKSACYKGGRPIGPARQELLPWTVTKGNVELIGAGYFAAQSGSYCIDVTGRTPGAIQQSFDTVKGAIYTVTFGLAANPEHPGTDIIHVSVGDFSKAITSPKSPFNKNVRPFPIKWGDVTFSFRATDSKSTIKFESPYGNKGVYGPCIDNVRIVKGGKLPKKSPNLIKNGDFEDSPQNIIDRANPDHVVAAGKPDIPFWTVGKHSVDLQRRDPGRWGFGQSGDFHIDLNGRGSGSIEQTFPTTPGKKYDVRFALAGNPAGHERGKTKDCIITVADVKKTITTPPGADGNNCQWETHKFEFTAAGENTTLKFEGLDSDKSAYGILLDNVAVVPAGAPIPLTEPDYAKYTVEYV